MTQETNGAVRIQDLLHELADLAGAEGADIDPRGAGSAQDWLADMAELMDALPSVHQQNRRAYREPEHPISETDEFRFCPDQHQASVETVKGFRVLLDEMGVHGDEVPELHELRSKVVYEGD
ncbi:hypothetical protein [Thioalkalivibrio sp. ALE19]|uniref:hypothetical protein n=1 Tax=Thioalkalivibrio sp. ALE19 TaxID=1266909 RepID=UPI0003F99C40|nr:hypothetical protein [Thioalkalivibrio sp. ALE19]